jgi:hypothetical protein
VCSVALHDTSELGATLIHIPQGNIDWTRECESTTFPDSESISLQLPPVATGTASVGRSLSLLRNAGFRTFYCCRCKLQHTRRHDYPLTGNQSLYEITQGREARAPSPTGGFDYGRDQQQLYWQPPWNPALNQSSPWHQASYGSFSNTTPQYMYLPPPSGQALYESPMNGTPQYVSGYPPLLPGQVASSPYSSVQATAAVFNAEVPQVFSAGAPYVSECTVQKCYQSAQPKKHAQ